MPTNQEGRHAAFRAIASKTTGSYNENLLDAAEFYNIEAGTVNEREILLLQTLLNSTTDNLTGLRAEFAAAKGVSTWNEVDNLTIEE